MKSIYKVSLFSIIGLTVLIALSFLLLKTRTMQLVEKEGVLDPSIAINESGIKELEDGLNIEFTDEELKCLDEIKNDVDEIKRLTSLGQKKEAAVLLNEGRKKHDTGCGLESLDASVNRKGDIRESAKERVALSYLYRSLTDLFVYYDIYESAGNDKDTVGFCRELTSDLFDEKTRAMFYQELAELSLIYPDDFVKEQIFSSYPLTQFYQGKDKVRENYNQLLKMGYEIHELMATDYQIALYYLEEALASKDDEVKYQKNVELFDRFMRKGDYHYYDHEYLLKGQSYKGFEDYIKNAKIESKTILVDYLYRARINDILNGTSLLTTTHPLNNEEVEALFERAMKLTADSSVAKSPERYEHFVRLYYAIFLNNVYGEQKVAEIKGLLEPIYKMKGNEDKGVFVFLQKEALYENNHMEKASLLNLAKTDSAMKDMLLAAGWKIE